MSKKIRRLGDQCKCPACGWKLDTEAYRCPKCFIYFCYKCRARVIKDDPQYQCADQSCECYGKLLCAACTMIVEETKEVKKINVNVNVINDGRSGATKVALISVGSSFLIILYLFHAWLDYFDHWAGVILAVFFSSGISFFLYAVIELFGLYEWFKVEEETEEQYIEIEKIAEHRCCIQCKHPVKQLA